MDLFYSLISNAFTKLNVVFGGYSYLRRLTLYLINIIFNNTSFCLFFFFNSKFENLRLFYIFPDTYAQVCRLLNIFFTSPGNETCWYKGFSYFLLSFFVFTDSAASAVNDTCRETHAHETKKKLILGDTFRHLRDFMKGNIIYFIL